MASNQELPTTSSTTTPDGSVVYPLPTPAVAVAATTTATNEVASSPATITTDWGHVCHQRLMDSSTSLESLLVILQDLKKALDNTNVNSTNSKATATTTTTTKEERNNGIPIPFMLTTLLPAVLTAFQTRTKPTPQSQSMDYPLRMACLEWVTQLVSISAAAAVPSSSSSSSSSSNTRNNTNAADHENPSNNNHYHALLRPGAPQVIAVALTVLIHDCEDPAVLASRLIFDLFKTYQTSITTGTTTTAAAAAVTPTTSTTTHIGGTGTNTPTTTAVVVQTYLDFVASLYRNLPTALSRNFRPSTLVPPPVSSSSSSSTIAAAAVVPVEQHQPAIVSGESPMDVDDGATENPNSGEETAAAADPMDVDDTPLKGQLEIAKTAAAIAHDNTPKESRTASIMKRGSSSLEAMSVASTASLGGLSVVAPVPPPPRILLASNASFKVLTECPLVVMLMFQLYPQFMKSNIPILIKVMMESLALRPPSLQSVSTLGAAPSSLPSFSMATPLATSGAADSSSGKSSSNKSRSGKGHKIDSSLSRAYFSRVRELVAAQAKTLSFLTYLLRTFSEQLKPYEDVLATNVVALMSTCPRESIGTRKELLVATRHLLNSDFRSGFYRHIDAMLDERLLMGTSSQHNNYSSASGLSGSSSHRQDPAMIRPLAYNALSDFVQHARTLFTMTQMSRVVCLFSRILHDTSRTLPLTSQYTAVRTLLSVIDLIFHNKDPDAQLGRDMLVRMLDTLVDKLQALTEYFPDLALMESKRDSMEQLRPYDLNGATVTSSWILLNHPHSSNVNNNNSRTLDSVRDIQSLIRAIIVGQKTIIYYISTYRSHRVELLAAKAASDTSALSGSSSRDLSTITPLPPPGSNEEVASAMLKITHTEIAIIDRYIIAALSAMKLLSDSSTKSDDDVAPQWHLAPQTPMSTSQSLGTTEKTLADQHRDALTYFAAAFTSLDGFNLRRSLGQRLDVLVDAIVADPMVMVVPRHLLGSNATTSFEFCSVLLDYLVERMDQLSGHRKSDFIFIDDQPSDKGDLNKRPCEREQLHAASQRPEENESKIKQRGATLLQLFERVLKSLSVHPDNETVVRRHLRRIVVVCLRSSMENTGCWPESYCMLVRYVFRSISAGKFEDSYRTLLPLISSVLNGLYRVVCSSENSVLRSTAIELCLTIPARLSSLLPHMNLLLRIIIPALDSNIGDLVNLG